jgi:hypothetical protein
MFLPNLHAAIRFYKDLEEIPAETHTCCYAPLPSHRWMQTQTSAVVLDHFR